MADESMIYKIHEVMSEESLKNETQAMEVIISRYTNYSRIIKNLEQETYKWEEKCKNLEYELRQKGKLNDNEVKV
jgi:hypothetical protein